MAQQLVQLAVSVLHESVSSCQSVDSVGSSVNGQQDADRMISDGTFEQRTSAHLFYTARSMFEMFASIVPVFHREILALLPQMAGQCYSLIVLGGDVYVLYQYVFICQNHRYRC